VTVKKSHVLRARDAPGLNNGLARLFWRDTAMTINQHPLNPAHAVGADSAATAAKSGGPAAAAGVKVDGGSLYITGAGPSVNPDAIGKDRSAGGSVNVALLVEAILGILHAVLVSGVIQPAVDAVRTDGLELAGLVAPRHIGAGIVVAGGILRGGEDITGGTQNDVGIVVPGGAKRVAPLVPRSVIDFGAPGGVVFADHRAIIIAAIDGIAQAYLLEIAFALG
jgi:hypothetical protein